ncbi:MAG: TetR/AcrR family transcriptional regulator [Candidatus Nanopelagicales bacterium]
MSRTLDPAAHAARRATYVEAADALLRSGGYARLSIDEVIAAAGGSKGGFYHYFSSKQELLAAVVERMTGSTAVEVRAIVDGPGDALEKFGLVVAAMPAGRRDAANLMLGLLEVWYADDNAALREAARQSSHEALRAPLTTLLDQGAREHLMAPVSVVGGADVLASLMVAMADAASRTWWLHRRGEISTEDAVAVLDGYADAIDRVLGVPPGTAFRQDHALLRSWFA